MTTLEHIKRKLRKIVWVFHEMMSPFGHVVWLEHKIKELEEAMECLSIYLS